MATRICIIFVLIQIESSHATVQTLCAGRTGVLQFQPEDIKGNITGIVQFTRRKSGENDKPFMTYNIDKNKVSHFEQGRDINVTNQYNIEFGNLQKSDEGKYTVSIPVKRKENDAVTVTATLDLTVTDPCFEQAKKMENCYKTECLTSNDGFLAFKGRNLTSMALDICNDSGSGQYRCCSPLADCIEQTITYPSSAPPMEGIKVWLILSAVFVHRLQC